MKVFGIKFSSDLIPLFGLPTLAVFLFQFSAIGFYVASNVERLEHEEASQWSFLLRGWPFFLLCFGTVLFLPVVASILSLLPLPGDALLAKPVNLVFGTTVVGLSLAAFIALEILRSRVRRNPSIWRTRWKP